MQAAAGDASVQPHREPIRCFEGTAKPHEPFWKMRNAAESSDGEPEMELYGYISEYSWYDDDVTPKMFKDDLYKLGNGGPITLRINSGGGDMIAASVMKSILIDYPGFVTVKVDGLAASAATVVAIAGDKIQMQESAYFMIHDPMAAFLFAVLNIEDMTRLLDQMKTAKSGLVDAYETRTKLSRDKLSRMMATETWMTAREAKEYGFIDEVIIPKAKKIDQIPQNAAIINALRNYVHVPVDLLMTPEPIIDPAAERLRAEAKIFR